MKKVAGRDFTSVWDAIADSAEDAANLRVRAEHGQDHRRDRPQGLDTGRSRASMRHHATQDERPHARSYISRFSLDALVNIAASRGCRLKVDLRQRKSAGLVRRSLRVCAFAIDGRAESAR